MHKNLPIDLRIKVLLGITGALIFLGFMAVLAYADTGVLNDAAWRADITTSL